MSSTDTADETLYYVDVTSKKRRSKKNHLSVDVKEQILNIYKSELQKHPEFFVKAIVQMIARKLGVGCSTVFSVIREYKYSRSFTQPKTNRNRPSFGEKLGEMEKQAVRNKVHSFFFRNEIPTTDKVWKVVNDDPDLPNFCRSTFYKLLKHLKLKFKKFGRISMLVDKTEIVRWRRKYLTTIKAYRNENRKIYYLDEVWRYAGRMTKAWLGEAAASSSQTILDGISTGLKNSAGKGMKMSGVICHIGSVDGLVADGFWCFDSKNEMNALLFEQWFSNLLPRLDDNSVIILEDSTLNSRKIEKIPTTASSKSDIQNWLCSKDIKFDETMLKNQLLGIVRQHISQNDKYVIDEMARTQNKTVLRLPPYHGELNPIKVMRADTKNSVDEHNTANITHDKWQKCMEHVQHDVESRMWELDNIVELQVEQLIINMTESDNDSDSSSSSSL